MCHDADNPISTLQDEKAEGLQDGRKAYCPILNSIFDFKKMVNSSQLRYKYCTYECFVFCSVFV